MHQPCTNLTARLAFTIFLLSLLTNPTKWWKTNNYVSTQSLLYIAHAPNSIVIQKPLKAHKTAITRDEILLYYNDHDQCTLFPFSPVLLYFVLYILWPTQIRQYGFTKSLPFFLVLSAVYLNSSDPAIMHFYKECKSTVVVDKKKNKLAKQCRHSAVPRSARGDIFPTEFVLRDWKCSCCYLVVTLFQDNTRCPLQWRNTSPNDSFRCESIVFGWQTEYTGDTYQ